MTTIIVTDEDNEIDEFEFDNEQSVISIGRRSTNDVCISNLAVSGLHARITVEGDSVLIEDLNSTNGTYVNGRLISRQLLDVDDEIVIGKARVNVQLPTHVEQAHPRPAANQIANDLSQADNNLDSSFIDDNDNDFEEERFADNNFDDSFDEKLDDVVDEQPMTLSEKAKLALGRNTPHRPASRPSVNASSSAAAAANRAFETNDDVAVAEAPTRNGVDAKNRRAEPAAEAHPLEDLPSTEQQKLTHNLDAPVASPTGAVIEIQNGAKSGQVLPIDKPVTTLGRPGIQIAAIMRKPDGYFLMHIESDDSVHLPTLNQDTIGDEPVLLHSGDKLNVAGIDVEFMLS